MLSSRPALCLWLMSSPTLMTASRQFASRCALIFTYPSYRTVFEYRRYLCIVGSVLAVGNKLLHFVSAVMTVVVPVLQKWLTDYLIDDTWIRYIASHTRLHVQVHLVERDSQYINCLDISWGRDLHMVDSRNLAIMTIHCKDQVATMNNFYIEVSLYHHPTLYSLLSWQAYMPKQGLSSLVPASLVWRHVLSNLVHCSYTKCTRWCCSIYAPLEVAVPAVIPAVLQRHNQCGGVIQTGHRHWIWGLAKP